MPLAQLDEVVGNSQCLREDRVVVPREQYAALLLLYEGMKDAGTGYSAKAAEACEKLKELGL